MAKIGFTKLGLKPNTETKTLVYNEQVIEIKQYLPIDEKLEVITNVINLSTSLEYNGFSNPIKVDVYTILEIIEKYTNINFTDKQRENPTKLYDLMTGNGLVAAILELIPEEEYTAIIVGVKECVEAFDKYRTSIMGVLDSVSRDYHNVDLDLENIQQKLTDPEAIATLKQLAGLTGFVDVGTNN